MGRRSSLRGIVGLGTAFPAMIFGLLALFTGIPGCLEAAGDYQTEREEQYVRVVIGEAADQGYRGMLAVAEVLRARNWDPTGFSGSKRKDLVDFVERQPRRVRQEGRRAVEEARSGSFTVGGATHFENVRRFGIPWWAKGMKETVKVKDHTFWRKEE